MTLIQRKLANTKLALIYHKRKIVLILSGMLITCSMLVFCADNSWRDAEGMTKNVINQIDDICNAERISDVTELVAVIYDDNANSLTIGGRIIHNVGLLTSISDIFTGISFCFIVLTFFMSFMSVREQEITSEELVKKIALFAAAVVTVFFAQDICLGIANIGTGVTQKVASVAMDPNRSGMEELINDIKQLVYEECQSEEDGWLSGLLEFVAALGVYLQLLIPSLAMWMVSVIINVICWSRALEIIILSTFAPVAFADATDIDHQIGKGSAARFVKNMLALALSGAIIIFVMALCSNISLAVLRESLGGGAGGYSFDGFVKGTKDIVIIGFAQAGLVLKAQSMAKTLCGVG